MKHLKLVPAALALIAFAQAQDVKVEKYRLPNGMTVILHEDHSLPIAAVNIWYKVGSKDEPERRSGFAHLFEHLMFMGTERVPNGKFDTLMEKYGGSNNASTAEDRTNYYESGPSSILPTLLWLEADRLEDLGRMMDQKKVDLQREVVKNERRQNTENTPYGKAYEAINGLMFPKGHPYSTSVIGSMEDLDNASVRNVKDFFATFYVPNNASMVVAGDFDSKTIKPLIGKLFGSLPRGNEIVRKVVQPYNFAAKRTTMVDTVQSPKTIMVWHSPAAYASGDIEMRLTGSILASGYSSRLYKKLVVDLGLASDVSSYQSPLLLGSLFYVEATAREGVSLDKLEKAVDSVLADYRRSGPTKAELDRQVAQISFNTLNGLQSLPDLADKLNEYEFYFGQPNAFQTELAKYRASTPAGIKTVAAKYLDPAHRLVLRVIPQIAAPAQNPRNDQPANLAEKPFAFPQPVAFKLANGIAVYYWQRTSLPITTLSVHFDAGAGIDQPKSAGLASITADMLDEGAGKLNAEQFTNALDDLGAQLTTGADQVSSEVNLTATTANFGKALPLLADTIIRPRFENEEWARVKSIQLDNIQQSDDDPDAVANRVANREFFGPAHPYSRPSGGTKQTVQALKLADVRAEYEKIYLPMHATIFACGSLKPDAMKMLLNAQLGKWAARSRHPAIMITPAVPVSKPRLVIVDKPGSVQTVIRIMMPTEPFESPNRQALTELGTAFGGTFTSRINHNLREEKGYTYGAGLRYIFSKPVSYIRASTSVRTDVTGASLKEFMKEFEKIRTGDVSDEEASKARSTIRIDTISGVNTAQGLIAAAAAYYENGMPFSSVTGELAKYAAIKAEDINALAQKGLPVENALIVLVGDKAEIVSQIKDLGLPEPEFVKP